MLHYWLMIIVIMDGITTDLLCIFGGVLMLGCGPPYLSPSTVPGCLVEVDNQRWVA